MTNESQPGLGSGALRRGLSDVAAGRVKSLKRIKAEMALRFKVPKVGEWVQPIERGYKFACCDCGLVHSMHFRIAGSRVPTVQFKAYRDVKATRMLRKRERITVRTSPRGKK